MTKTTRELKRDLEQLSKPGGVDVEDLPGYTINRILAVGDPDNDLEEIWYSEELGVHKLSDGRLYRNIDLEPYFDAASGDDGSDK